MYCTSLGKAILAYSDEEIREQILGRIRFHPYTEQTLTSREALLAELEQVKAKGFSMDRREMEDHMECVGAPVFGPDGSVLGAISVSSLYKPAEDYEQLGERTAAKAREVSKLLGFLGKL